MSVFGDLQATYAATLVDEWVRCGLATAVVCPGSRSTPLALALAGAAGQGRLSLEVRLDERSAGFFGLGVGLATGCPALVLTTSGTAAVELHPAVVEASQGRVPLVVCTADRPVELQQVGAPQTIEQEGLYGGALRWAVSPGVADGAAAGTWRSMAARMMGEARCGPGGAGPVHANLAFREPLVGRPGPLPPGRSDGRPWHRVVTTDGAHGGRRRAAAFGATPGSLGLPVGEGVAASEVADVAAELAGRRGLIVVGAGGGDPMVVQGLAGALRWPLLADPRSGARLARPGTVAAADALLRCPEFADGHRPEVVLRLGAPWASRVLATWLGALGDGVEQVMVDPWWAWADPERTASTVVRGDPTVWCRAVTAKLGPPGEQVGREVAEGTGWLGSWVGAESAAQRAIDEVLAGHPEPTEPGVARTVLGSLPPDANLVVASSMPVRDLEWYGAARSNPPRVLSNRGANGIDGTLSTTLGVAAANTGQVSAGRDSGPTVALVGDLAFLYDAGALLGATERGLSATFVILDNAGGGIFSFLPQAQAVDHEGFELLWGTPQAVDLAEVATAYRVGVTEVGAAEDVAPALARAIGSGQCQVLRVRTDRQANVAVHEEIHEAVAAAVASFS